jgi:hypothetical protein
MNNQNAMASHCGEGMKPCNGRCIPQAAMCASSTTNKTSTGSKLAKAALGLGAVGAGAVAIRNRKEIGAAAKTARDTISGNRSSLKAAKEVLTPSQYKQAKQETRAGNRSALGEAAKSIGRSIESNARADFGKAKDFVTGKPDRIRKREEPKVVREDRGEDRKELKTTKKAAKGQKVGTNNTIRRR